MNHEENLIKQGWQRQSTLDEPRLSEAIDIYKEIGYEVHLEPFHAEDEKECTECMLSTPGKYFSIYTKKISSPE